MIDVSVYGLEVEEAQLILSHLDILGFFYTLGVITFLGAIIYCAYKGCFYLIDKIKERKLRKKND